MKKLIYSVATILCLGFTSCEDFLYREPMDFGSEEYFFYTEKDLAAYTNSFYSLFPKMGAWWGGLYSEDNNSDNQTGHDPNSNFYPGEKVVPNLKESEWKFDKIREINYFLEKVNQRISNNEMAISADVANYYLGEAYFFRAYEYFRLLSTIGDAPIIKTVLPDNFQVVVAASKRSPRNEVARFILEDLDKAIEMMPENPLTTGRLCKDAARVLKARVALYEGTWLKYHKGTALVPGTAGWPGRNMYPDFQFKAGSVESEINFFLEQAIETSQIVADNRPLYVNYSDLFNRTSGAEAIKEIILARYYRTDANGHSASNYLSRTGGGCGLTRSFVESFLTVSGTPIYAASSVEYLGDKMIHYELQNRDLRLSQSVKNAGRVIHTEEVNGETVNDTIVNYLPMIYTVGQQGNATGYEVKKWVSFEDGQDVAGQGTSATPVFRSAEAYLIYLEAYYERYNSLDNKCDLYWRALRRRAGVNEDYHQTIAKTDLTLEKDLAVKSRNQLVSPTLYNIRRERRCEFIAEGMRLKDLKRWRSMDHMVNYQIEGMNLWEEFYKLYDDPSKLAPEIVSQPGAGKYVLPLRRDANSPAYKGYNFPKAHYLEPIPVSEIIMTSQNGDVSNSVIYQNPAWPNRIVGPADYNVNLD